MIVIVEGIDGIGKTTLCKRLEKELGFKYFNDPYYAGFSPSKIIINEKIITALEFLKLLGKGNNIVLDRFHASEYVYGMLDRRYVNLFVNKVDRELAEMETQGYDIKMVLLDPENEEQMQYCQAEHSRNLEKHAEVFVDYFKLGTAIKNKIIIGRSEIDECLMPELRSRLEMGYD